MTDKSAYHDAFVRFRYLPFPSRPQGERLRNWSSGLLELDTFIAGYAMQVESGTMRADEVPNLDRHIEQAKSLLRTLDTLTSEVGIERPVLEQFRTYLSALLRMLEEMAALAGRLS